MFNFVPLIGAQLEAQRARQEAEHAAALASCYMAASWRPAGDIIDVEAREVLEPRLIGHEGAR